MPTCVEGLGRRLQGGQRSDEFSVCFVPTEPRQGNKKRVRIRVGGDAIGGKQGRRRSVEPHMLEAGEHLPPGE